MSTIPSFGSSAVGRAARALRHRPGFTIAAVLTLALGLGATTAMFGVVYGVLLKPLPYLDAHELVNVRHTAPGLAAGIGRGAENTFGVAESMYVTYRDENRVFEHVGLYSTDRPTLTGSGAAEQIPVLGVTDGVLQALAVQPALGRAFSANEYTLAREGPEPVIVSYAFWQRRLGGDESVLGRVLSLDFQPFEIVGVMPAGFRFLDSNPQPDVIGPIRTDGALFEHWRASSPSQPRPLTLAIPNYTAIARLKDGVTLEQANADLERMLSFWLDAWPPGGRSREAVADWRFAPALEPLKDSVVGGIAGMLWVLMATVGAVLLIACANIANLLLARADARRHELAIRAALGAGRRRIAGELMRESFALGALGGALGLGLAYAGIELLAAFAPPNLPRVADIVVGAPVLAFAFAAAFVASVVFGSIPAMKYAFGNDVPLRAGARGATATRERNGTRNALIVVQTALALVLLVGAGLMIRTFDALTGVDPGFDDAESIELASIFIPFAVIPEAERYTRVYREVHERIAALPGVTAAGYGVARSGPLEGRSGRRAIAIEDRPVPAGESPPLRRLTTASPGYFEAFGTRLVAGRGFRWADIDERRPVALVSADLARELWGEPQAAIGKRIRSETQGRPEAWQEIVGVTEDVHETLFERPPPTVHSPLIAEGTDLRGVTYAIRSNRAGTESFANEIRRAVWSSHPDIVVTLRTMQSVYSASLAQTSFALVLLAIAGAMALLLSVVGIYGVMSYVVAQRTREVGIRLTLGARPSAVQQMFVRNALAVAAIGIAVGLAAAAAFSRYLTSLLFEVRPLDPPTYLAVIGVLLAAALLAAYVPARRAARLDPVETLRAE